MIIENHSFYIEMLIDGVKHLVLFPCELDVRKYDHPKKYRYITFFPHNYEVHNLSHYTSI